MTLNIAQEGIEIGIVTRDVGPMLEFYRDILGLEFERELLTANGMHMTRLKCGPNIIKLVVNPKEPKADAPPPPVVPLVLPGIVTGQSRLPISMMRLRRVQRRAARSPCLSR